MAFKRGLRETKKDRVKQALFEAAMSLFREKGFDAASVDEIAERAGYSRATYFNHFGAKRRVLRHYGERLLVRMEQLLAEAEPESHPLERIRQMLLEMAQECERQREDLKLVFRYSLSDPDYLSGPTPARLRVFEMLSRLIAEAQDRREVRLDLTAEELALHIFSFYQSLVWVIVTGRSAETTMRSAWRFILGGVHGGDRLD